MTAVEIRVAVLGDPARGYFAGAEVWGDRPEVSFGQRPGVDLTVTEDTLLVDALRRAADRLGVPAPPADETTGYYREHGGLPATVSFASPWAWPGITWPEVTLPLLDDHGWVVWHTRLHQVRYRELLRAHNAGVLPGDPRRPVLVLEHTGAGYAPGWVELSDALQAVWQALEVVDTAGGAAGELVAGGVVLRALARRAAGRVRRYRTTLQARHDAWQQRGVWPDRFLALVRDRGAWHAPRLAAVLGITDAEAQQLLADNGFRHDPVADVWRPTRAAVALTGVAETFERHAEAASARSSGLSAVDADDASRLTAAAIDLAQHIAFDHGADFDGGAAMRDEAAHAAHIVVTHFRRTGQVIPVERLIGDLRAHSDALGALPLGDQRQGWVPPP